VTPAPGLPPWPALERPDQAAAIREAINTAGSRGVVVTGATGIGKTTEALRTAAQLSEHPLHIHGSEFAREAPFAALAPWLAEHSPPTGLANVAAIASALQEATQTQPGGVAVIVVDPAPLVDNMSAYALAQVAKAGLAQLVIVGRTLADIPEPFLEMWRDGLLGAHQVTAWSTDEIAQLLTRRLGAPVALWSVQELGRMAGHQPLFLRYLVEDQLSQGTLTLQDGTWVLQRSLSSPSPELAAVLRARLNERTPAEQRALELVALAGEVSYDAWETLVTADVLEPLLDTDLFEVSSVSPAQVRLRHPAIAEMIRSAVPLPRRRRLRAELLKVLGSDPPSRGPSLLSYAMWTLDCGAELEPATAIEAARQAIRFYDPALALRLVDGIADPAWRVARQTQLAAAHRLLGQVETSVALLAELSDAELAASAAAVLDEVAEEFVLVAAIDLEVVPAAHRVLDLAEEKHGAQRRLQGLRWELLAAEGRYLEIIATLDGAIALQDRSEEWVLAAGAALEALSLTGRQHDALELAGRAAEITAGLELSPTSFDIVHAAMFGVFMKCGLWSQSRDTLLSGAAGRDLKMLLIGAAADSAIGMTYVLGGYASDARRYLGQALAQSRIRDVRRTGPQIAAGLAYAAALEGDHAAARSALADWTSGPRTYWNISASGDYLAWCARLIIDGLAACEQGMLALAREHAGRGLVTDQLLILSAAARAGSEHALAAITQLDVAQPGPLATAILTWAQGRRDEDPDKLILAAQQLLAMGNPLFAREAAQSAVDLGGTSAARARTLAQQASALLSGQSGGSALDGLTPREQEVCRRAARGETNKDIAAALFLSVRTVESYLQAAFAKLGVRGRAELSELLSQ
jgi:DNA-binding CsgD family transcriptional regulator